jgi:hypothetical protein
MQGNFLFWTTLVVPALRTTHVVGLLGRTDAAPTKTMETEGENKKKIQTPNQAYTVKVSWVQTVVGFLNSLSPVILAHGLVTNLFSSESCSKVQQLRGALNNTKELDLTAT